MNPSIKTTRTIPSIVYDGHAAEDIEVDSVILKINCPELLPHTTTGAIGAGISTGSTSLKDRDGTRLSTPVITANHFVATWEGDSNVRYPPLIRKGEPVEIYKKANQDKFYWRTTGKGREFRTTDRVHIEVGATDPTKPGVSKTDDNTYSASLDSDKKKVSLKTSQANGEVTAFSMEADLKEGTFHISDNTPGTANRIFMDTGAKSGVPVLQLNLSSGAVIKLQDGDIFIKAPKRLMISVGERLVFDSPLTVFNLSSTGVMIFNASSVAFNSTKNFIVTAACVGLNGATKVGGVLVAAAARIANVVRGSAGGNYNPSTIARPEETPVVEVTNSPDTDTSGTPYD